MNIWSLKIAHYKIAKKNKDTFIDIYDLINNGKKGFHLYKVILSNTPLLSRLIIVGLLD